MNPVHESQSVYQCISGVSGLYVYFISLAHETDRNSCIMKIAV